MPTHFRYFLAGLAPRAHCVNCLSRFYEVDGAAGTAPPWRAVQRAASRRRIDPVSDATQRDNQFHTHQQSQTCEAPDCTNPGGAFTSERDGRIYEFCSEACRAVFERPAA